MVILFLPKSPEEIFRRGRGQTVISQHRGRPQIYRRGVSCILHIDARCCGVVTVSPVIDSTMIDWALNCHVNDDDVTFEDVTSFKINICETLFVTL